MKEKLFIKIIVEIWELVNSRPLSEPKKFHRVSPYDGRMIQCPKKAVRLKLKWMSERVEERNCALQMALSPLFFFSYVLAVTNFSL